MKNLKLNYNNKELWLMDLNYFKKRGYTMNAGINNEGYWIRIHG